MLSMDTSLHLCFTCPPKSCMNLCWKATPLPPSVPKSKPNLFCNLTDNPRYVFFPIFLFFLVSHSFYFLLPAVLKSSLLLLQLLGRSHKTLDLCWRSRLKFNGKQCRPLRIQCVLLKTFGPTHPQGERKWWLNLVPCVHF